ncbi:MAG: TIR domain-containing protein [Acidobacteriota bacterium]|nr:TIR domain-containing protein [Acidobacteriota bacterium]
MTRVDRSNEARQKREPDLFLSHSSRDKGVVRQLAEDLSFLEVDAWLDEWELQVGDSLHDVIAAAMEKSGYVAIILGDNYADSQWARDEMKQALARERRQRNGLVLPLIFGTAEVPAFLEDKVYLDFTKNYYEGLARLAGIIHTVSRKRIEDGIAMVQPQKISQCIKVLRYCGVEPYVVVGKDDWSEIQAAGGVVIGERVRFDPASVASARSTSPRIRHLMQRLEDEVWTADADW